MTTLEECKALQDSALSCLSTARSMFDQHSDPTQIPAEEHAKIKALMAEGHRLRDLADTKKSQLDLESWAAKPASEHPAVQAMAGKAGAGNVDIGEAADAISSAIQKKAFFHWMRAGAGALNAEERKALTFESKAALIEDATGIVLVPADITGPIFKTLPHRSVFRSSGPTVRATSTNRVDVRSLTGATAGWGQLEITATTVDANVVAGTPTQTITVHDLTALSRVGVDELADTDANLSALIQQIVGLQMSMQEDDAFANGTGTSQPWGLAMRATQASPLITQAVTATAQGTVKPDELKSLQYAVPTVYRNNGAFFASDDAAAAISLLKDTTSNYLWQPSVRAGEPDTLFGKRFFTLEGLPALTATSAPSVMYGDPELGYMVAQREAVSMQRLDERYAELGLVGFLFRMRVGGDVIRPAAWAKYVI